MRWRPAVIAACLVALTATVFGPLKEAGFVNYDDEAYVTQNAMVRQGLTWRGAEWALTSLGYAFNWHPLTWLSHMADVALFGERPWGHHLTSVLIHAANAVILFLVLRGMTGALWPCALAAALFAAHPLHVESVAWISERKDVLGGFFWLMAMGVYLRFLRRPGGRRYAALLAVYVLGLMAKPMLVTLPFVLLLADWWPLGRLGRGSAPRLILEKAPLLAMSAASSVMTCLAQRKGGALIGLTAYAFHNRLVNALVSYCSYLQKMVWPSHLAIFYPYPAGGWGAWPAAGALACLAIVTAAVLTAAKRHPYALAGWLWYLGTLVPVIGLVQAGGQSMADRYTYLPLVGIFMALAFGLGEAVSGRPALRAVAAVLCLAALLPLAWAARLQAGYWRDSFSLFTRALEVTEGNWLAEGNLGAAYYVQGNYREALEHFGKQLRIKPKLPKARYYYGNALSSLGRNAEAVDHYREAIRLDPGYHQARVSLGIALAAEGRIQEALEKQREALRIRPDYVKGHLALGDTLSMAGRMDEAAAAYRRALEHDTASVEAYNNLGAVALVMGDPARAETYFGRAVGLSPGAADTRFNLGLALELGGKTGAAAREYREALKLNPGHSRARAHLEQLDDGTR